MITNNTSRAVKSLKVKAFILMTIAFVCIFTIIILGIYIGSEGDVHLLKFILIGTSLICITIISILLYFLIHTIIIPINRVSKAMEKMAEGDFTQILPITGDNEIGVMERSFNLLAKNMLSMHQLIEKINSGERFENTFQYVFDTFNVFIPYDRIGMAIVDEKEGRIRAEIARSREKRIHLSNGYSLPLVHTSLGKVIESGNPRIINDLEGYLKEHPHSESTRLIVTEGMRASLTLPLKMNDKVVGVLFFSSSKKNAYNDSHITFLKHIASHLSVGFEKSILVGDLVLAAITAIVKLAESRDNDTGKHIDRVRNYSVLIARRLSKNPKYADVITENFVREIYNFSSLHDIGKVGIQDNILLKPGKLTEEEFEIMKTHTLIGGEVLKKAQESLKDNNFYAVGLDIILYHHEKYNGEGYPYGLSGEDIPLAARIAAVADVFDALTSKRPYKDPFSIKQSMQIIYEEKGKSFDPDVVDAFLECEKEIIKVYNSFHDHFDAYEEVK
ncbi:HD domain-containing phosphohydrolase [Petroclostridium sp. X23]|uniref:HD-GYP domain-containing protein n=1 Tax=Petroclostridium sp. X23 TaxID=3045146 RepID=UPI0024ADB2F3|nr:HD domain-containing phosphohydrolase [Petroclostridium sp. X23]WHH60246.1 HD domain-containing phosphohydrolase [Petroclostridium sp. X23]